MTIFAVLLTFQPFSDAACQAMIAFLDGKLAYKDPAVALVDVGGVGYEVRISLQTFSGLPAAGEKCRLFTHLHIREDAQVLFGFLDPTEKSLFMQLIGVSGIGPTTALVMLSSLSAVEIRQAILQEDLRVIQGIKGIGSKTAQRVILELKDVLRKENPAAALPGAALWSGPGLRADAVAALTVMGIQRAAAEKSVDALLKQNPDYTVEELIRQSLR